MTTADDAGADALLAALTALVEPLWRTLPGDCEVVLHDLRRLPDSIVAVAGDVTGRNVGGPATDMLLRGAADGTIGTRVGYETRLPDGRSLQSTTVVLRDARDRPVAALCVNSDVMIWRAVQAIAESMLPGPSPAADDDGDGPARAESFATDIDELAQHLLTEAIGSVHVPVSLMQKRHKIAVVKDLRERGFFMLKESVETAAQALQVTRFTIYNYLNELEKQDASAPVSTDT